MVPARGTPYVDVVTGDAIGGDRNVIARLASCGTAVVARLAIGGHIECLVVRLGARPGVGDVATVASCTGDHVPSRLPLRPHAVMTGLAATGQHA